MVPVWVPINFGMAYVAFRLALLVRDPFSELFRHIVPDMVKPYYDPMVEEDRTATLMGLGALVAYIIMAMGVCTLLDAFPSRTAAYKIQGARGYFSPTEWWHAAGVSLGNAAIFSWLVTIPAWQLQKSGILRGGTPLVAEGAELELLPAVLHFVVHGLVVEVWFYWTHAVLHWPIFYTPIHKFHHRFKAPTAVACMYANPIEYCIGNVLGVVLGPAITNCHPYSAGFWMCFSLISTSMGHSGYKIFGCDSHDAHHEHFDYNFGVGGLMDALCGTAFEGSKRQKAILAKKAAAIKAE